MGSDPKLTEIHVNFFSESTEVWIKLLVPWITTAVQLLRVANISAAVSHILLHCIQESIESNALLNVSVQNKSTVSVDIFCLFAM